MKRSASIAVVTSRAPSRRQRVSRNSSISAGISGRDLTNNDRTHFARNRRGYAMARLAFIVAFAVTLTLEAAVAPFPSYFTLPSTVAVVDHNRDVDEIYSEAGMPLGDQDNIKRGHYVSTRLQFAGIEADDT